jgi:very-short-patch-repair endonuclease
MLKCKYCGRECKNKNSLTQHEIRCKSNPNGIIVKPSYGMLGKKGKNQYIKAKETGIEYIISDEHRKKMSIISTGRKHSEETKQKISEHRKKYLELNPDKIPYVLNHSSKISYPEQYFLECFVHIVNKKFQHNINRYIVDFANIQEKLYLEIDGEQHYVDTRIVAHDNIRTQILSDLGWTGIRIRWAEFKKLSDESKKEKIQELINFMKWN